MSQLGEDRYKGTATVMIQQKLRKGESFDPLILGSSQKYSKVICAPSLTEDDVVLSQKHPKSTER